MYFHTNYSYFRDICFFLCGNLFFCVQAQNSQQEFYENSLGMQFVKIPSGDFMMGTDENPDTMQIDYPAYEHKRLLDLSDEAPAHKVTITKPFFMGKHEVTVGQFRQFLELSSYVPESIADGTGGYGYNRNYDPTTTLRNDAFQGRDIKYDWQNPGFTQNDQSPVLNITWNDAVAMAKWLSKKENKNYRLPTEAEWEYSCRAGRDTRYFNGNNPEKLVEVANLFDADKVENWSKWRPYALKAHGGFEFTAPVGSFAPNTFGLYDMIGNAWEWVSDWHEDNYYQKSPMADPQGPPTGNVKVRRGGSWHTWALYARCGFRNWNTPSTRYTLVGMRLLLEANTEH